MTATKRYKSVRRYLSRSMMSLVLGTSLTLTIGGWFLLLSPSLDSIAQARISQLSAMVEGEMQLLGDNTQRLLQVSADWLSHADMSLDHQSLNQRFMPLLSQYPEYSSMLLSDNKGNEWMLFQKQDGSWLNRLSNPQDKDLDGKHRFLHWSERRQLERDERLESDYEPLQRPWYREAMQSAPGRTAWTEIYRFYNTGEPGITASMRLPATAKRELVIGLDLRLMDIARYLGSIKVGHKGMAVVLSSEGRVLGLSTLDGQPDQALKDVIYKPVVGLNLEPLQIGVNLWLGRDADRLNDQRAWHGAELWHIGYRRLDLGDEDLWLGVYLPVSELIPGLRYQLLILASVLVLALAITLYLAIGVARKFSLPLEDLADNSRRIGDLDFTAPPSVHSPLREVEQLARTQEQMRHLLADAHQDLYRKNRQLQDTQERLIQAAKLESVGRLAAGVAHEVKNPLAIVQMGIDYFQQEPLSEDAREVLVDMDDAVGRADGVVKGLLDFSRERRLNLESGDINEVIRSSEHLVEHEFKQHDIQLIQQLSEELPRFALDADKLRQVFINLFINAIQAMGQKGVLTVSSGLRTLNEYGGLDWRRYATLRNGEQVIYVEVRDTGPGISEDQRARIFDPFFTTKAVGQGTGLGLSVSRNIIELHGGHIDIRNHDGGGASVQLLFKLDKGSGHDTQNPRR